MDWKVLEGIYPASNKSLLPAPLSLPSTLQQLPKKGCNQEECAYLILILFVRPLKNSKNREKKSETVLKTSILTSFLPGM